MEIVVRRVQTEQKVFLLLCLTWAPTVTLSSYSENLQSSSMVSSSNVHVTDWQTRAVGHWVPSSRYS